MVGAKLYERGASIGQLMAFLIASPWNSLSLTIIMVSLIGWQWTLMFIRPIDVDRHGNGNPL